MKTQHCAVQYSSVAFPLLLVLACVSVPPASFLLGTEELNENTALCSTVFFSTVGSTVQYSKELYPACSVAFPLHLAFPLCSSCPPQQPHNPGMVRYGTVQFSTVHCSILRALWRSPFAFPSPCAAPGPPQQPHNPGPDAGGASRPTPCPRPGWQRRHRDASWRRRDRFCWGGRQQRRGHFCGGPNRQ